MSQWHDAAACKGEPTDLFYDDDPAFEAAALAYCSICPVRDECASFAVAYDERHGIFGGYRFSVQEERELAHTNHQPKPIPNHLPRTAL